MKYRLLVSACAALSVAACSQTSEPPAPAIEESQIPLKEFMGHVLQRNAEQVWSWTTWISDKNGNRYTKPETEEDWTNAESDALTLQQLTYVLDNSHYRIQDDKWPSHVAGLRAASGESATAIARKDFDAMLVAADKITKQCYDCHVTYVPELEGLPPKKK